MAVTSKAFWLGFFVVITWFIVADARARYAQDVRAGVRYDVTSVLEK